MKGKILKVLGGLLVLLLVLAGPTIVFWIQWMMPAERFPHEIGSTASSTGNGRPALQAQLAGILAESREAVGAPSLSAAIARDGELVWAGTNGYAAVESQVPATPDHLYRLGSTSKPLTAIILARMLDEGSIDLSMPIGRIDPNLPEAMHNITAIQLASHTAGIRHYSRVPTWLPSSNENITPQHFPTVKSGLTMFLHDDLMFEPGTAFSYSTFGYSLLSYVMEQVTESPFSFLLQQYLNAPLGVDVRLDDLMVDMPYRAGSYVTGKGNWGAAYPADPSYKWAGGGIAARPRDLAMIGQALLGQGFLSSEAKELSWTPVALPDSETNPQNYGLGWRIDTSTATLGEDAPVLMIHHGGRQMGGAAFWALYPELGISVAVISNTGNGEVRDAVQTTAYAIVRAVVADP